MNKSTPPVRFLIGFGLVCALSVSVFADTLRLRDGSIIKGRIVTFGAGRFTVVVGEGTRKRQLTFDAAEVDSIDFDSVDQRANGVTAERQPAALTAKEPVYVETTAAARNNPRVVTTDNIGGAPVKTPVQKPPTKPVTVPQVIEPSRAGVKPVEVAVKVLADNTSNGWTNSGWVVKKGQKVRIIGDGKISLGGGKSTGPSGLYDVEDAGKLLKSVPTGALIAVIGDDNNEFIYVGSERTFTASRDGALFLGVNEGNLEDNSGAFDVTIEIEPA